MDTRLNTRELRARLARRGWPQWKLAAHLDVSLSTFSSYVSGRLPAPKDLVQRIEEALSLPPGSLSAAASTDPA